MQCNKKQLKNQSLVFIVIFWYVRSLTWKSNADVGRELENGWISFFLVLEDLWPHINVHLSFQFQCGGNTEL